MKIKRFESKEEKVKDQEVLFTAKSLEKDKEEKPSFKTEVEDNEKVQKEFKKSMDKIEKFENFTIEIEVKPTDNSGEQTLLGRPESSNTDNNMRNMSSEEEVGCGCCDQCNGQEDCECCDDCNCGSEGVNPESDVKVMNIEDFISSLNK
jgi:hypothetical protein